MCPEEGDHGQVQSGKQKNWADKTDTFKHLEGSTFQARRGSLVFSCSKSEDLNHQVHITGNDILTEQFKLLNGQTFAGDLQKKDQIGTCQGCFKCFQGPNKIPSISTILWFDYSKSSFNGQAQVLPSCYQGTGASLRGELFSRYPHYCSLDILKSLLEIFQIALLEW